MNEGLSVQGPQGLSVERPLPTIGEYSVTCRLLHGGRLVSTGVGTCSTMESKYRYRQGARKCPNCGAEAIIKGKVEYGGGWVCYAKKGGCNSKFLDSDPAITSQSVDRVENPDPADNWNTCKKIGKKRAYVDAIITATGVSDTFTQDAEDIVGHAAPLAPEASPPPPPQNKPEAKADDIDFDPSKPDAPQGERPVNVEWKPVFKLTPEESAAWKAQGWASEKRTSRTSGKEFVWIAVPENFDPGAYPTPPPIEQPTPAQEAEKQAPALAPASGKVDSVALASAMQTAESRAALNVAWAVVLKVQKDLDAKTLTGLGKIKQQKEASLPVG
jgi:hypothetical protein